MHVERLRLVIFLKRRDLLAALFSGALGASKAPLIDLLSVQGYIFQQFAERNASTLTSVIPDVLPMAREAGFTNIELNPAFFAPDLRSETLSLISSLGLRMPSLYVGGGMHSAIEADRTLQNALRHLGLAQPFGCKAIVNNPDPKPGGQTKTEDELKAEAEGLNRMATVLAKEGCELRVHHHTPQLEQNAREWRYILAQTDAKLVKICVDVDWAYESGFQPVPFLQEVGDRLREIHVRSARNKLWLEDVEDSDIDYRKVADYLKESHLRPLTVVELAYRPQTIVTRSLDEDLRLSRIYTEEVLLRASRDHIRR